MKFIVTKELGKLARWLRILGFDAAYFTSDNQGALIVEALRDNRTVITRKKERSRLLGKKTLVVTSDNLEVQLKEVVGRLRLKINQEAMFTRCTVCNTVLEEVKKEKIKVAVPEYVAKTQNSFRRCPECKKIYWQGSHWGKVNKVLNEIREATGGQ